MQQLETGTGGASAALSGGQKPAAARVARFGQDDKGDVAAR
jgi:hypothetical protein